jgi:DNA mismatch repair ATPase MutS
VKLCEEIAAQERVHLCHMQTQQTDDDFVYTYRLEPGISNIRGGVKVLRDLGYPLPLIKACQHELQSLYV